MKRVAWFLSIAAHNWLSSRRWEIQNWICSGWKGIEILPHLVQKLGKSFPNFLCLGITGCSKYHSHWQFSLPALCRSAKRQKRQPFSFSSILSFLPCFFTFPARITRRPPITPHTGVPSSCYLLAAQPDAILPRGIPEPITGEATAWGASAAHTSSQQQTCWPKGTATWV